MRACVHEWGKGLKEREKDSQADSPQSAEPEGLDLTTLRSCQVIHFDKNIIEPMLHFPLHSIGWCMISVYLISDDAYFDRLIQVVSASFPRRYSLLPDSVLLSYISSLKRQENFICFFTHFYLLSQADSFIPYCTYSYCTYCKTQTYVLLATESFLRIQNCLPLWFFSVVIPPTP